METVYKWRIPAFIFLCLSKMSVYVISVEAGGSGDMTPRCEIQLMLLVCVCGGGFEYIKGSSFFNLCVAF